MRERAVLDAVLREVGGLSSVRLWRQNAGKALDPSGRYFIQLAPKGASDLVGIVRRPVCGCGVHLAVETKGAGRQTEEQKRFQAMIESLGGIYVVARSPQDVLDRL